MIQIVRKKLIILIKIKESSAKININQQNIQLRRIISLQIHKQYEFQRF